ncbi:MAG: hypothetical protein N3A63_07455 [Bacteroidetes bacterium]|nr:hypothetical protein [Bacteroidota bacterium]
MKNFIILLSVCIVFIIIIGCDEKYPLDTVTSLAKQTYVVGDTTYLEIVPPFMGFRSPSVLYVGKDNLLYIADSNRIVMMNFAGTVMGERAIDNPSAIAQDWTLDLLVAGTVSQQTSTGVRTIAALFRIHLVDSLSNVYHDLSRARIDTVWKEITRPNRRFVGIGTMPDNTYLVARTGPDNSSPIDPDTRVMRFSKNDKYITPVTDLATGVGNGIQFINQLTTLITFPNSRNFLLAQQQVGVAYAVLWLVYKQSEEFEGWQPRFDPTNPTSMSVDFIRPYRYVLPKGLAIDDRRLDIFIADAGLDSIVKFNSRGQFKKESFGPYKVGHPFHPTGVAFFDKTLYVSDKSQRCIFRFKLSTDF